MELKKLRKLVLQLEEELEHKAARSSRERERELERLLAERERELRELRRRSLGGGSSGVGSAAEGALREAEERNAELEDELENVRRLLEENMDELERLRDMVERGEASSIDGDARARRRMEEITVENDELRAMLDEHVTRTQQHEDEREELFDQLEALQLKLEDFERRREAEAVERSESRAMILEEREGREGLESEMNGLRDKLTAASIEIQQKEDELEIKSRELRDLYEQHQSAIDDVESSWQDELQETKAQLEGLRDVRILSLYSITFNICLGSR